MISIEIFNRTIFFQVHGLSDMIIRKRVCQFVVKFFSRLNADADLDYEICDTVVEMMKERIKVKIIELLVTLKFGLVMWLL